LWAARVSLKSSLHTPPLLPMTLFCSATLQVTQPSRSSAAGLALRLRKRLG
jgi:hypothetical protein